MRRPSFTPLVAACASLFTFAVAWSTTTPDSLVSGEPQEAIWRVQEFDLHFRGATGRYHSCSSLHSKISGIMEAVGAGKVIVRISCSRDALVNHAFAHITTAMPMPATPDNVRAATSFGTEQALAARVRNIELPTPATIERFPAEYRTIAVKRVEGVRLGSADCDLLQDLHDQVLPHLPSVRVVRKSFVCGGFGLQPARPILIVEALVRRDA